MSAVKSLEKTIGDLFKGAPVLPKNVKNSLVQLAPILTIVMGVLQLFSAWGLWEILRRRERIQGYGGTISRIYTPETLHSYELSSSDRLVLYLGIVALIVVGIIFLKAYSGLKKQSRVGWDLVFLALLVYVGYALCALLVNQRNFESTLFSLLWSTAGFYLLFQVRERYKDKKSS